MAKVMDLSLKAEEGTTNSNIWRVHDLAGTIIYVYEYQMEAYDE
jgi:hypothetical protein